jgi:hypothetical protein
MPANMDRNTEGSRMIFIPKVDYVIIMRLEPKINAATWVLFET